MHNLGLSAAPSVTSSMTIHFLMRLRTESQRHGTVDDAISRTFHFSGRGIVITSVILVAIMVPESIAGERER